MILRSDGPLTDYDALTDYDGPLTDYDGPLTDYGASYLYRHANADIYQRDP